MFQVHFPPRRSIGKNHSIITIIFRIFGQRYFINSRFAGIDTHRSFPFDIGSLSMSKSDSPFIVDINLRNPRVETHHFQRIVSHVEIHGFSVHIIGNNRYIVATRR